MRVLPSRVKWFMKITNPAHRYDLVKDRDEKMKTISLHTSDINALIKEQTKGRRKCS